MPRDGTSGVFTRTSNTFSNPTVGQVISPTDASLLFNDYDTGISGSVAGPGSSVTDNAIARWDLTTGKFIQNSTVTISDLGVISGAKLPLTGYISGLTLSTAGSTNTYGIATGIATDSTAVTMMSLGSAYTKTTSAWAVGSGNGSLDTGSIAAGWYHVWLIQRSDTGVVDVLLSTSPTSPTMPTNYDRKRRIGSMINSGGTAWVKFSQSGNIFLWDAQFRDVPNSTTTTSATLHTLSLPSGVVVDALITGDFNYAAGTSYLLLTAPDQADTTPTSTQYTSWVAATVPAVPIYLQLRTNTSQQIRSRATRTDSTLSIFTRGWIDYL